MSFFLMQMYSNQAIYAHSATRGTVFQYNIFRFSIGSKFISNEDAGGRVSACISSDFYYGNFSRPMVDCNGQQASDSDDQMCTYALSDTHAASSADHNQMKPINPVASQVGHIGQRFLMHQRDARDNTHPSPVITQTSLLACCCEVCVWLCTYD